MTDITSTVLHTDDPFMKIAPRIAAAIIAAGEYKKDRENKHDNYTYLSTDALNSQVAPALANAGIAIFPALLSCDVSTTDRGSRSAAITATVRMLFTIACTDASVELPWIGVGVDYSSADKAVAKAITTCEKYFLMRLMLVGAGNTDGEHEQRRDLDNNVMPQHIRRQRPERSIAANKPTAEGATETPTTDAGTDDAKPKPKPSFYSMALAKFGATRADVDAALGGVSPADWIKADPTRTATDASNRVGDYMAQRADATAKS